MSLKIIKAGLLDTIQDGGRYGYQHLGINPGGAMDSFAAGLGAVLLGKNQHSPVVELHFPAAQILFQQPAIICLTGADFTPCINNEEVPINQPIAVGKSAVLSFAKKRVGARCYLSLYNELQLAPWLNSYSTNLKAAGGGFKGRQLLRDDTILFEPLHLRLQKEFVLLPWKYNADHYTRQVIEVIPGPEWSWLNEESRQDFLHHAFLITPASDRMGYRLQGAKLVQEVKEELVSSGVGFGTVQLLPNGQLIVLMADHQTTGGYPRIANVIKAHLPLLAQKSAGGTIRFASTTVDDAQIKWIAQQKFLSDLQNACKLKLQNWMHAH